MKKTRIFFVLCLAAIIGVGAWLLSGADPKNAGRQDIAIDVTDEIGD